MVSKNRGWWLFPLLLSATLLQNFYDISAVMSGSPLALYRYDGPIILKLGKDLLYLTLFLAALSTAIRIRKPLLSNYSVVILTCLTFLFLSSALTNGLFTAAIGIRWAFPLVLFLVLRDWLSTLQIDRATSWLFYGLFICLFAQIYQLFFMPPVFGEIFSGISARTPGIFITPNSTAFFACASAACIMTFPNTSKSVRGYAAVIAVLISALAQSGTGIITSFILITLWLLDRHRTIFLALSLIIFIAAFSNLSTLTQRESDYVQASGGGRIDALIDISKNSLLNFTNFGKYTNASNLSSDNPEQARAPDSLPASWIGNFGILSLPIFFALSIFILTRMQDTNWKMALPCLVVFLLFSMTTIVLEAFPMNIMLIVGILISKKTSSKINK